MIPTRHLLSLVIFEDELAFLLLVILSTGGRSVDGRVGDEDLAAGAAVTLDFEIQVTARLNHLEMIVLEAEHTRMIVV